jgi:hypothetical protein
MFQVFHYHRIKPEKKHADNSRLTNRVDSIKLLSG